MELVDLEPGDVRLDDVWKVMGALREHLDADALEQRYAEGHPEGYRITAGWHEERCVAAAGWRITTSFAHGRSLYVDDLVVEPSLRSQGHGAALLTALEERAAAEGCARVRLDSGVQRHGAHRFYFRNGYRIASYGFTKDLPVSTGAEPLSS